MEKVPRKWQNTKLKVSGKYASGPIHIKLGKFIMKPSSEGQRDS